MGGAAVGDSEVDYAADPAAALDRGGGAKAAPESSVPLTPAGDQSAHGVSHYHECGIGRFHFSGYSKLLDIVMIQENPSGIL